ncbi:MAG: hypothetical protein V2I82_16300 [Halieaceae bacterium]|jgi:hypothetical protein|nr:hypothetical protein [Halieaceae bacterium]
MSTDDRRRHDRGTSDRRRDTLSEVPLRAFVFAVVLVAAALALTWASVF